MAVQWCTFVQFTKNHVQSENLHLRLDILHRLVFFSRTHPPSWGVFHGSESTRIKIHPSTAASVNEFFLVLEIAFFVDKICFWCKKTLDLTFGKEWPDRFVPSISKISWFVMPCLGGKMAPVAGMLLEAGWVRSKNPTLPCWLHKCLTIILNIYYNDL